VAVEASLGAVAGRAAEAWNALARDGSYQAIGRSVNRLLASPTCGRSGCWLGVPSPIRPRLSNLFGACRAASADRPVKAERVTDQWWLHGGSDTASPGLSGRRRVEDVAAYYEDPRDGDWDWDWDWPEEPRVTYGRRSNGSAASLRGAPMFGLSGAAPEASRAMMRG
jgi:hypothetical protein